MLRHLGERYGEIDEQFFINYELEAILSKVGMGAKVNESEILAYKS